MKPKDERWAPVYGYEGLYEVSTCGRIRGLVYGGKKRRAPRIKTLQLNKNGYMVVVLWKNGKGKGHTVHRIVLTSFVSNQPSTVDACHINHNRLDNSLDNLKWGSRSENEQDKRAANRSAVGDRNGQSKLTTKDVIHIRHLHKAGMRVKDIVKLTGHKQQNISAIINRKSWRHI